MGKEFKYDLKEKETLETSKETELKKEEKSAVTYKGGRKLISDTDKDILAHPSSRIVTTVFTIGAVALLVYCIAAKLGFFIVLPAAMLLVFIPLTIASFLAYQKAKKNEEKEYSYFSGLETDMREHIIKIEKSIKARESVKMAVVILWVFTLFAAPIAGSISIVTFLSKNPGQISVFGIVCIAYFVVSIVFTFIISAFSKRKYKIRPADPKVAEGAVYSCIVLSEINGSLKFRVLIAVIGVDRFLLAVSENIRYEKGQCVKVEYDGANLGVCKIVG